MFLYSKESQDGQKAIQTAVSRTIADLEGSRGKGKGGGDFR